MSWFLEAVKKYAVFRGRSRRREYWFFALFYVLFGLVLTAVDVMVGSFSEEAGVGLLGGLFELALLVPAVAVTVRRLHDTGRSGWWLLVGLVPVAGAIVLLVFMVLDGDPGANRFGESPKASAA